MDCVECGDPSVSVPLITGEALALWCNEHLIMACAASISRLGQRTHNLVFSVIEHNVWFWEADIRNALQAALDTFFEEIARDLHSVSESVYGLEELIRVKAKELAGSIEFSQQEDHVIKKILPVWLSSGYASDIQGPLGKDTTAIIEATGKGFVSLAMAQVLTCMTLSAKRAASYAGHGNSAVLVKVERNIWESHKLTIEENTI